MSVEITPEPSPDELEAVLVALAERSHARDEPSRWWRAGIREAVEGESSESRRLASGEDATA